MPIEKSEVFVRTKELLEQQSKLLQEIAAIISHMQSLTNLLRQQITDELKNIPEEPKLQNDDGIPCDRGLAAIAGNKQGQDSIRIA